MKLTQCVMVACAALLLAIGCDQKEQRKKKPDVEINAPGVHIEVDKRDGVEVDAPGVQVDVDKKPNK